MPRSYLRYAPFSSFGVVAAPNTPALLHPNGKWAVAAALQSVIVHHLQHGTVLNTLSLDAANDAASGSDSDAQSQVTRLALHPTDTNRLAVGYSNGLVRVWDIAGQSVISTYNGHSSAITALVYTADGSQLYSGGSDTTVCQWDTGSDRGVCVLKGHRDAVTALQYTGKHLLSASKDGTIKVWDTVTQHCVQTLVAGSGEVWSIVVDREHRWCVAGGAQDTLTIYQINTHTTTITDTVTEIDTDTVLTALGTLSRQTTKRVSSLSFSPDNRILAIHSTDKILQLYSLRTDDERQKRAKRKRKRTGSGMSEVSVVDEHFAPLSSLRLDTKIAGCNFAPFRADANRAAKSHNHRALITLADNSLRLYEIGTEGDSESDSGSAGGHSLLYTLDVNGHRTPIRATAFNSSRSQLLTAGNGQLKVWDFHSGQCIRTIGCGDALCLMLVPGDRHAIIGTKTGTIEWYDLVTARMLGRVQGHAGSVLSIDRMKSNKGFITGGTDKKIHEFEFELIADADTPSEAKVLSIVLVRSLTLTDDVLCVRYSANGAYIAVGLLDSTVRIFHSDSLTFHLSLYGHRLPVLDIDFSTDGQLIATGSADKNIKVWGIKFGDCHASIFAHADSVTRVKFLPSTHMVVSVSKDGSVKLWDGDSKEFIQELRGHTSEIWALDVLGASTASLTAADSDLVNGELIVTAGNDRSVRVWQQTDEPLFPDEEHENRLEQIFDSNTARLNTSKLGAIAGSGVVNDHESEGVTATRVREVALKGSERLIEAIQIAKLEADRVAHHQQQQNELASRASDDDIGSETARGVSAIFREMERESAKTALRSSASQALAPNPLLLGRSPAAHVLTVLQSIPSTDLTDCLLTVPFNLVIDLMAFLLELLTDTVASTAIELVIETILVLLTIHEARIVGHGLLVSQLKLIKRSARRELRRIKDECGMNLAALSTMHREQQLIVKRVG